MDTRLNEIRARYKQYSLARVRMYGDWPPRPQIQPVIGDVSILNEWEQKHAINDFEYVLARFDRMACEFKSAHEASHGYNCQPETCEWTTLHIEKYQCPHCNGEFGVCRDWCWTKDAERD